MSSLYSAEERAFRDELRSLFVSKVPGHIRDKVSSGEVLEKADYQSVQRTLNAHGLAVPHWPAEWGGRDWTPMQLQIFTDELQCCALPLPLQFNCYMLGPVLAKYGTPEQKQRFLPRAANLDDWWCQGFSEPEAGSDLASIQTSAVRTPDGYRVNGQKTWTTFAHYADWMFCLVRTDTTVKKQAGISFLLIDMTSPGVTVRPIITIDGRHEVNEVFFDNVEVPLENRVGEENQGWTYAKFLLGNERSGIARVGLSKERVARVRRLARQTRFGDATFWDHAPFRTRLVSLEAEIKALELTQMRLAGDSSIGAASSMLKIKGSQLQQAATELLMDLAGADGLSTPGPQDTGSAFATYLNFRKVSIYGGSNEIQRNILAAAILGPL